MAPPERWWVTLTTGAKAGGRYTAVSSPTRPKGSTGTQVVAGPFPDKAAADTWISDQTKIHVPKVPIPNPLSGIGAVAHWLGDAVLHIFDPPMWRSLGWLALGAFLVIAGIYLWFRTSSTYKGLESAVLGTAKAL